MILFDFSGIIAASFVRSQELFETVNDELGCRHFVLNSLRASTRKFKSKYGTPVLCLDDRRYWRKGKFSQYKQSRKQKRSESTIDWEKLFRYKNQIIDELKGVYPGKVIQVDNCEADDLIAVLSRRQEQSIIISRDTDFCQLQINTDVKLFDPIEHRFRTSTDPMKDFQKKLIRGDIGDGIPSILMPDDSIVSGIRAKPVRQTFIDNLTDSCDTISDLENKIKETQSAEVFQYWCRNREMIDFDYIPDHLVSAINQKYDSTAIPKRDNFLSYLIQHKLGPLIESLQEF